MIKRTLWAATCLLVVCCGCQTPPVPLDVFVRVDVTGSAVSIRSSMETSTRALVQQSLDAGRADINFSLGSFGQESRTVVDFEPISEGYNIAQPFTEVMKSSAPKERGTKWAPMLTDLCRSLQKSKRAVVYIATDGEITDMANAKAVAKSLVAMPNVLKVFVGPCDDDTYGKQMIKSVNQLFDTDADSNAKSKVVAFVKGDDSYLRQMTEVTN